MNCHDVMQRLDDYIDRQLAAPDEEAIRAHLGHCHRCRQEAEAILALLEETAALPRSIPPERDLWQDIARRVGQTSATRAAGATWPGWSRALAAAAATAVFAAVITGYVLSRHAVPPDHDQPPRLAQAAGSVLSALGAGEMERARDELLTILAQRRDRLSPDTMKVVDSNLDIIGDSIAGIAGALEQDPGNPRLSRMLMAAYRQEIDLLRRAIRLPDGV